MELEKSSKASYKDICEQARKHYEKLSYECSDWLSTIPRMIDFYEKYYPLKNKLEKMKIERR